MTSLYLLFDQHYILVAVFALSQVAFYFAFKFIVGSLDPTKAKRQEAKAKSNKVLGKLGVRMMIQNEVFLYFFF